jgi:hypothetical protein
MNDESKYRDGGFESLQAKISYGLWRSVVKISSHVFYEQRGFGIF